MSANAHEQIVIIAPFCKVLPKEDGSRLNKKLFYWEREVVVLSDGRHQPDERLFAVRSSQHKRDMQSTQLGDIWAQLLLI